MNNETGRLIFAIRNIKGMTQAELADVSQLHRPQISEMETGQRNPTPEHISRLEEALGVNFDDVRPAFQQFAAAVLNPPPPAAGLPAAESE